MKNIHKNVIFWGLFCACLAMPGAWEDHSTLSFTALSALGLENRQVVIRSLSDFVADNEAGLEKLFAEMEDWCVKNIKDYPPLPKELSFSENSSVSPEQRIMMALRVNPDYKIRYYRKAIPEETASGGVELPFAELAHTVYNYEGAHFYSHEAGDSMDALSVLATASDEPDYGLDIGLFKDNDSWYGRLYGFGEQSFGDPRLVYGSQAPFHMGFYNEAGIVYAAAPSMKRVYPELRTVQFSRLARFAMDAGEDYWAYRFLGWGLHYLQDQLMPYHASIMPGSSAAYLVWVGLLDMMGVHGPYNKVLKEVSDKHMLLELLQLQIMYDAYKDKAKGNAILAALKGKSDKQEAYEISHLSKKAGKASKKAGNSISKALGKIIKNKAAFESINTLYEVKGRDIYSVAYEPGTKQYQVFESILLDLFENVGAYTRAWLDYCLAD